MENEQKNGTVQTSTPTNELKPETVNVDGQMRQAKLISETVLIQSRNENAELMEKYQTLVSKNESQAENELKEKEEYKTLYDQLNKKHTAQSTKYNEYENFYNSERAKVLTELGDDANGFEELGLEKLKRILAMKTPVATPEVPKPKNTGIVNKDYSTSQNKNSMEFYRNNGGVIPGD